MASSLGLAVRPKWWAAKRCRMEQFLEVSLGIAWILPLELAMLSEPIWTGPVLPLDVFLCVFHVVHSIAYQQRVVRPLDSAWCFFAHQVITGPRFAGFPLRTLRQEILPEHFLWWLEGDLKVTWRWLACLYIFVFKSPFPLPFHRNASFPRLVVWRVKRVLCAVPPESVRKCQKWHSPGSHLLQLARLASHWRGEVSILVDYGTTLHPRMLHGKRCW